MNKFKDNDKVLIIEKDANLEQNVVYTINRSIGDWIAVKTDTLRYLSYDKFKLLSDFRKDKINKIMKKI